MIFLTSIKDVAKACNVSVATVSKALNDHHDISEATKKRVIETASEMGYHPNSSARALKTNRTYNLGVIYEDQQRSGLAHEYFSKILECFRVKAENCGYDVTFISASIGKRQSTYLEHCHYRGVDGVCIVCADFLNSQIHELVQSGFPVVTIDHSFHNRTCILSNNVRGMEELTQYVYKMGHRRIAFIHGEMTAVTETRRAGFYKACYELGLDIPDEYVIEAAYHDGDFCEACTNKLLALKEPPTCIFFPDDVSAIGGLSAINQNGLSIPDDISVAGYDGIMLASKLSPSLTSYYQDVKTIGTLAAEKLVLQIEKPKTTLSETISVVGHLQEGASVASPSKS